METAQKGQPETVGGFLRADVRLARLDHRIRLAARRAQRGGGRPGPRRSCRGCSPAAMLSLLALTYAELGATYPVAGGAGARSRTTRTARSPGFTAGWAAWLQAVFIAPIEVLAAINYVNSVGWVQQHFNMLTPTAAQRHRRSSSRILMMLLHRDQPRGREVPLREQHRSSSSGRPPCRSSRVVVVAALQLQHRQLPPRAAASCRSASTACSPR